MGSKGDGGGGDEDELKHLFEGLYIFHVPPTGAVNPRLHAAYPPLDEHSVVPEDKLALFCFPYDTSHAVGLQRQFFTFGLTTASSALFYGYCLQEQPATPASTAVLFCLVSRLPWHVFFRRLLGVVADSYDVEKGFGSSTFLDALRTAPGVSLSAPLAQAITISPPSQKMVLLHTPDCRRPLVHSALPLVDTLVNRLSAPNLMQVFASLLTERRIIVTSGSLSMLTDCVHAMQLLLFPFTWQHVFIPALPRALADYCCATLPFLIGVHSSLMDVVSALPLEAHVHVNLDTNEVFSPFNDADVLPSQYVADASTIIKNIRSRRRGTVEMLTTRTTRMFVDMLQGYSDYIKPGRTPTLELDRFALTKPRNNVFLHMLCSTQMFAQFLLAGPTSFTTATTTSSSSSNSSSSSGSSGHRHSTIIFGSARDNHELFDEYLQASACTRSPLPGQRQRRRKDRVVSRIKRAAKSVRIKSRSPGADRQRNHSASPAGPSSLQSTISFTQLASTLPDSVAPTPTHTHTRHSHNNHQHQQQQQQQPQQQQQHHGASSSSSSSPPGRPSTRPHSLPPQEGEWTPTPPPRRRSRKTAARSMLAQHAPHTPSQPPPRPPAPQSPATRATTASAESSAPPSSPATTTARTSTGC